MKSYHIQFILVLISIKSITLTLSNKLENESVKSVTSETIENASPKIARNISPNSEQLSVGDLNSLENNNDKLDFGSNDFDDDFKEADKKNVVLDNEEDLTDPKTTVQIESKKPVLDFDEDDTGDNIQAKLEILEITANNRTSYTEGQMLIRYIETDLHIPKLPLQENLLEDDFEQRKKALSQDELNDVNEIKSYIASKSPKEQTSIRNELLNNMNGVSELTGDEEDVPLEDIPDNESHESQQSLMDVSNPQKLAKENQELQDIMVDSKNTNDESGSDKMDMKDLMDMFSGSDQKGGSGLFGSDSGGSPNFMDLMKSLGSNAKGDAASNLKNLANTFGNLMKNPEMAKMMGGGMDSSNNNKAPISLDNFGVDGLEDKMIAPAKKESLKEKFAREVKETKQRKKLKKQGFALAKKPEWGGMMISKPKIEKTEIDKETGDKNVFIDFGEMEKDNLKNSFSKDSENSNLKMNPKPTDNSQKLEEGLDKSSNLMNVGHGLEINLGLSKVGQYTKIKRKEKRLILV